MRRDELIPERKERLKQFVVARGLLAGEDFAAQIRLAEYTVGGASRNPPPAVKANRLGTGLGEVAFRGRRGNAVLAQMVERLAVRVDRVEPVREHEGVAALER